VSVEIYFLEELADLTSDKRSSIYYYYQLGLIKPVKTGPNRILLFDADALKTLLDIKEMKAQGIPLKEIRRRLGVA
jgi:DNA-binding transcriptional MerR regulator